MKTMKMMGAMVCVLGLATVVQANLITNGNFDGQSPWTVDGGAAHTNVYSYDAGTGCVYVYDYAAGTNTKVQQIVDVLPNTDYTLSWYAFGDAPDWYQIHVWGMDSGSQIGQAGYYTSTSWQQYTAAFNSGINTQVAVQFAGANWSWNCNYVDGVMLVPEPISLSLLGLGGLALLRRKR